MARRISPSQLRSKLRQAQAKIRQAENKRRQAINRHNQSVRRANAKIRAHNARVRAHRNRLRQELQKLARAPTRSRYVTFRASVEAVQRSYVVLERRADEDLYDDRFNQLLDLSEREAANSASVMNVLQGENPEHQQDDQFTSSGINMILAQLSSDFRDRWRGALFALNPSNPDAARHFCTSSREILTAILEGHATNDAVQATLSNCDLTQEGKPTRRSRIRFLLHRNGISDDALTDFVENDIDNVVQLFNVFNRATHGPAGNFSQSQLQVIRTRVEDAISFLGNIVGGQGLQSA